MKKNALRVATVLCLASALTLPSCIGSFTLSSRLLSWNKTVTTNKFLNELVFLGFCILPVYEVSVLADIVVLNSIEFWSGDNPMACGTKRIEGTDGQRYLVKCDGKGYDIISENDGSSVRLDFDAPTQTWSVALPSGEAMPFMTIIDADHVAMPDGAGHMMPMELTAQSVDAYRAKTQLWAAR